ncbi:SMI1/KNR4 family protein [Streptomyces griseorubiginosus]|uniref:hypothetical protein n=1 Tax=Streptomyces griseorubiginosus TaxID=67304 RepID=UPI0036F065BE
MTYGTPGLVESWQRFTDWLGVHAPADHATLRPGCADGDLGRLEDGLGFAVHDDVRATLELHDGVVMRRAGHRSRFLSPRLHLVAGRTADVRWVPLARNISGICCSWTTGRTTRGKSGKSRSATPSTACCGRA